MKISITKEIHRVCPQHGESASGDKCPICGYAFPMEADIIRKANRDNDGYCKCKIHKTPETKCMCKEFLHQQTSGWCHCHLYYKEVDEFDHVRKDD